MKKLIALLLAIILLLSVSACSPKLASGGSSSPNKPANSSNSSDPQNGQGGLSQSSGSPGSSENSNPSGGSANDKPTGSSAKPTNISESYKKYSDMKSASYESISEKIKEHNELYLDIGFSLLAIVMVDLSYLPVSMLGLEGGMSALSMLGINDAKVDQKGDTYTISYKNGEDERLVQICEYDASSDSVRSTISMEGSSSSDLVMEYVSSGDGYACQYFSRMDNGEYDLITMFFSANGDVAIGMSTVSKEPGSIYKNTGLKADFVLNDESYFLLEGGKLTVFSDGEKKTY